MKKEIENFLIEHLIQDVQGEINLILNTQDIAEFVEFSGEYLVKDKLRLKELKKHKQTLEESLNV